MTKNCRKISRRGDDVLGRTGVGLVVNVIYGPLIFKDQKF
jgi:hypothetical protein